MASLDDIDLDHLRGWVGREEEASDTVTDGLIARFRATLGDWLFDTGADAPLGLHWCLAPSAVPFDALGPDGHAARGGFLPPIPFESRMWAGGALAFHAPLRAGDRVNRRSRIASVTGKQGRSGPLVFVAVEHTISVGDRTAIAERQDLVYRPAQPLGDPQPHTPRTGPPGTFTGDPVTLFRYSALTFNGHRIHYDHPYVTQTEGYADLVVHGPLQATLLMNAIAKRAGTGAVALDYRGLSPLVAGVPVALREAEDRVHLETDEGRETFEARPKSL
ncbi:hypothetical protein PARPLA_02729 [Rhodobacteraceae bacterium THAF1]|uniref:FAS1-like dehydratase domain-containing protein n=1 Tax=Palleronia sp. THAF1 TaxID=2587842 RepID=UPI000F3DCC20|nr:MaoC family dehydratase N-terminal domain-containing protein [Palleronia sp. THAF1]QFU08134.1 hypothetical protein FIU81_05555 [Palleronia sp. THAF1]VDC28684.1 hypothetical protein PARPLA_02729 [Rhodobacteraceae bacterium THAF1]